MSTIEERFHMMQQQLLALQEQLNGTTSTPMQAEDDPASVPLPSMGTRPHYDWSPSTALTELMNLDTPLHTSPLLSDLERKAIIESYPPMAHLEYRAPTTIPAAERLMNKSQRYEDNSLKHLQYLLSAAFRPLDILSHELVSTEAGNPNLERYCTMLRDIRKLLLHVCSTMNLERRRLHWMNWTVELRKCWRNVKVFWWKLKSLKKRRGSRKKSSLVCPHADLPSHFISVTYPFTFMYNVFLTCPFL